MNLFLNFFYCFLFVSTYYLNGADTYKIDIPNSVIASSYYSRPLSINDHDEILIQFHGEGTGGLGIWSNEDAIELVPLTGGCSFWKLGNNGVAIGSKNGYLDQPAIWSPALGIQTIDITKDILDTHNHYGWAPPTLIDINSFGRIIGTYEDKTRRQKAFIWEYGKAREFSINQEALNIGYEVISLNVITINDQGAILGSFEYGYKHPLKDVWIVEGTKFFLWNGKLNLIEEPVMCHHFEAVDLNNKNEILVHFFPVDTQNEYHWTSSVWMLNQGHKLIVEKFFGEKINDYGQILGHFGDGLYCIFDNGQFINIALPSNNSVFKGFSGSPLDINNNGVITAQAHLWNECHVIKLTPIK